jgi:5-methylcytosine-specific restriction protein A
MPVRPPTFRPKGNRSRREARAEYDARRGSARERGYDRRWDVAASAFKREPEHALCLGCKAVGRITACDVVDHVEPHKGDMVKFWNRSMWQPACQWHHDVIKQQLERLYEQGKAALADLWLNSEKAKELTILQSPRGV